ncbi:MAG TPA: cardiolipin synthase [Planctomycetaceae bacterium]|jgi:cardiolipin synthase|nr:cardiolipin synthase [Planctomycetaceae bacterium]
MENINWWTILLVCMDLFLRLGISIRVVMRRLPIGVSLAWIFIVVTFPFAGAIAYLLLGELRLGVYRAARAAELRAPFQTWLDQVHVGEVDWSSQPAAAEALARMCQKMTGMPVTAGNRLDLIGNSADALKALVEAINEAKSSCHLEFYIWTAGGIADRVAEALMAASARGVVCRMLLDDVGSREFLRSDWVRRLEDSGVSVEAALRARLWRLIFVRFDLRLHRKLAIIDGRVAYTGSMNLVDARLFKRSAGVGEWVDACVRVEGPAVEPLGVTFLGDWALESEEDLERLKHTGDVRPQDHQGTVPVQVLPSGPSDARDAIERILLAFIYSAQQRLILTTPYFVPDEALLEALTSAAQRGVKVTLIMPEKVDSRLARLASRAIQGDLVAAGVQVLLFRGGLLHTKSVCVDGEYSLFGSLNLDPRSLHLNFEITLAIYDREFTSRLEALQATYTSQSRALNMTEWRARGRDVRLLENVARLLGPLL